jgi:hypothetical protein
VQDQVTPRLETFDDELTFRFWWPVEDAIANREVLEFGHDRLRAGAIGRKQQPIDPSGRVPLAATPSHLHQPGPDSFALDVDRRGVIRLELWLGTQVVAGEPTVSLGSRRAVGPAQPLERAIRTECTGASRNGIPHTSII